MKRLGRWSLIDGGNANRAVALLALALVTGAALSLWHGYSLTALTLIFLLSLTMVSLAYWQHWRMRAELDSVREGLARSQEREVALREILESMPIGAEEQLRRSEMTMHLTLEHLPVGVWLADRSGNIIYGNPASRKIWEGAAYVSMGQYGVYRGWHADTGKKIESDQWALTRAIREGVSTLEEVIDIQCFDGSRKTILNSAVPIFNSEGLSEGAIVINQDITAARKAELVLRDREASLARAQAQAHLGSWVLDLEQEEFICSEECARIFGITPTSSLSLETLMARTHEQDVDRSLSCWSAVTRGEAYDVEYRLCINGEIKWVRQRVEPEFDEDGDVCRALGTVQDITEIKLQEEALLQSQQKLRELVAHHERIREEERTRIAREIHDEMGQQLTALRMDTAMMQMRFAKDNPELEASLKRMKSTIDSTIAVVRNVASSLRPSALDMGLMSATEWLLGNFQERTGVRCHFEGPQEDFAIDDPRATAVFRILQESLTNITRHAQASNVYVSMRKEDEQLQVTIRDDGVGFDHAKVRIKHTFGLMGMRERAKIFGGESRINSKPGEGTSLKLTIPLENIHQQDTI